MAGLDPAIHEVQRHHLEGVDARVKPGHDDFESVEASNIRPTVLIVNLDRAIRLASRVPDRL